jgi:hypothetical protein
MRARARGHIFLRDGHLVVSQQLAAVLIKQPVIRGRDSYAALHD